MNIFLTDTKKACNEDPNLLILESNNAIIADDDSTPLYKTSFVDLNILRITFLVTDITISHLAERHRIGPSSASFGAATPSGGNPLSDAVVADREVQGHCAEKWGCAGPDSGEPGCDAAAPVAANGSLEGKHSTAPKSPAGRHSAL